MKACGLENTFYSLDSRFKDIEFFRFHDDHIKRAIDNTYNKIYEYGQKAKMKYIDYVDIDDGKNYTLVEYEQWVTDVRNDDVPKDEEWDRLWWEHVFLMDHIG